MPKFMLLLHDRAKAFDKISPDEMQRVIQKYATWGRALKQRDLLTEGNKLTPDPGRIVRRKGAKTSVTDGPYAETKELLGGYFIVKAKDYDAAAAIALDCPHLEFGGSIEIRQVD